MKPKDRKKALSRVPGRGLHMDGGTRIVPAKNKDRRRPVLPDGVIQILTEEADKHRLGSGCVDPLPIHCPFLPGEVLLLMSDGAWTPLGLPAIQRACKRGTIRHFSDLPSSILEEAGKRGCGDDMTIVAIRA